jgi:hypothetical protein
MADRISDSFSGISFPATSDTVVRLTARERSSSHTEGKPRNTRAQRTLRPAAGSEYRSRLTQKSKSDEYPNSANEHANFAVKAEDKDS